MAEKINIKFRHDFAEGLIGLIDEYLGYEYPTDDDKLVMAGLAEIRQRLYLRLARVQKEYSISLSPVQALSLRILYTEFVNEPTSYMGSKLLLISNEVAKKYAA